MQLAFDANRLPPLKGDHYHEKVVSVCSAGFRAVYSGVADCDILCFRPSDFLRTSASAALSIVNCEINYIRRVREAPYESEEISRCLMRTTFSRKL